MNMRGAGDSARVYAGLYNAGLDLDPVAAMSAVTAHTPHIGRLGGDARGGRSGEETTSVTGWRPGRRLR